MTGTAIKSSILAALTASGVDWSTSFQDAFTLTSNFDEMDELDIAISFVLQEGCPSEDEAAINLVHSRFYDEWDATITEWCAI